MRKLNDGESGRIEISELPMVVREDVFDLLTAEGVKVNRKRFLNNNDLWTVDDSNGKMTKRIAKYIKNETGAKLSPSICGAIGDLVTILPPGEYSYDIVSKFDWEAGDFGDRGSCFWSSFASSRRLMECNWFYAFRIYRNGDGYARAWVYPNENEYILFNAYGLPLEKMAILFGMIFDARFVMQIKLGSTEDVIYVNDHRGYVVSEGLFPYDEWTLEIDPIPCDECCSEELELWDANSRLLCKRCFDDLYFKCTHCGEHYERADGIDIHYMSNIWTICSECAESYPVCDICDAVFVDDLLLETTEDSYRCVCEECADRLYRCNECGSLFEYGDSVIEDGGIYVCNECCKEE